MVITRVRLLLILTGFHFLRVNTESVDWSAISTDEVIGVEDDITDYVPNINDEPEETITDAIEKDLAARDWQAFSDRIWKLLRDAGLDTPENRFFAELVLDLFRPRPYTDGNLFLLSSVNFADSHTLYSIANMVLNNQTQSSFGNLSTSDLPSLLWAFYAAMIGSANQDSGSKPRQLGSNAVPGPPKFPVSGQFLPASVPRIPLSSLSRALMPVYSATLVAGAEFDPDSETDDFSLFSVTQFAVPGVIPAPTVVNGSAVLCALPGGNHTHDGLTTLTPDASSLVYGCYFFTLYSNATRLNAMVDAFLDPGSASSAVVPRAVQVIRADGTALSPVLFNASFFNCSPIDAVFADNTGNIWAAGGRQGVVFRAAGGIFTRSIASGFTPVRSLRSFAGGLYMLVGSQNASCSPGVYLLGNGFHLPIVSEHGPLPVVVAFVNATTPGSEYSLQTGSPTDFAVLDLNTVFLCDNGEQGGQGGIARLRRTGDSWFGALDRRYPCRSMAERWESENDYVLYVVTSAVPSELVRFTSPATDLSQVTLHLAMPATTSRGSALSLRSVMWVPGSVLVSATQSSTPIIRQSATRTPSNLPQGVIVASSRRAVSAALLRAPSFIVPTRKQVSVGCVDKFKDLLGSQLATAVTFTTPHALSANAMGFFITSVALLLKASPGTATPRTSISDMYVAFFAHNGTSVSPGVQLGAPFAVRAAGRVSATSWTWVTIDVSAQGLSLLPGTRYWFALLPSTAMVITASNRLTGVLIGCVHDRNDVMAFDADLIQFTARELGSQSSRGGADDCADQHAATWLQQQGNWASVVNAASRYRTNFTDFISGGSLRCGLEVTGNAIYRNY